MTSPDAWATASRKRRPTSRLSIAPRRSELSPIRSPDGFGLPFGLGGAASPATNIGLGVNYAQPYLPTPYVQQRNFGLQQQLGGSPLIEAGYDDMTGTHLPDFGYPLNQLQLSQLGPQINQLVPHRFDGIVTVGTLVQPTIREGQLLTAFPQYSSANVQIPTAAASTYNALLLKAVKRFSHDLTFMLAYTCSKLIDDNSGIKTFLEPATPHQDAHNRRADRSISDQDVSQRFVTSFSYGPFGKGKLVGGSWPRALNALAGGWQVTGIVTLPYFSSG